MNYANMIEESKLKKGFIIATLVSTVLGTFSTSMALHDKIQEKRKSDKQRELDDQQTKQIQKLQQAVDHVNEKANENEKNIGNDDDDGKSRSGKSRRPQPRRRQSKSVGANARSENGGRRRRRSFGDDASDSEDDGFDREVIRSRDMIEQQYRDNVQRLGGRYAQGDVIAENKLQGQIISLQQTVINVLQDAMMNDRKLSKADIDRLIRAQQTARQGSLDALQDQYDRMLDGPRPLSGDYDTQRRYSVPQRQLAITSGDQYQDESFPPPRRMKTLPASNGHSPDLIYCRYAVDLQSDPQRNLHSNFSPQGSHYCPACDVRIPVSTENLWHFETRTTVGREDDDNLVEVKEFTMDARLVVKSHTPSGELACYLCFQERDKDAFCPSVEALIKHLGSFHNREEFEREDDMWVERERR